MFDMLTDTHCHLDYDKFDPDRKEVIERAINLGVVRMLVPGLQLKSSRDAVLLAEAHPSIFAAAGFHPTDLDDFSVQNFLILKQFGGHPKLVAVGEIGLDYYWVKDAGERSLQRTALLQQLQWAQEINKPVVIHMREENDAWSGDASRDLLHILMEWHSGLKGRLAENPGVLHSFNGNLETAQKALAMNFYLGITGPVTYKNGGKNRELAAQLPLEKLLIETDSPFLTPVPHRGKRNEPAYVRHIADKIAEIHSKSPAEIAAITTANAARLFAWGD